MNISVGISPIYKELNDMGLSSCMSACSVVKRSNNKIIKCIMSHHCSPSITVQKNVVLKFIAVFVVCHIWEVSIQWYKHSTKFVRQVVNVFFFLLLQEEINNGLETLLLRHCHLEAKLRGITKVLPNLQIVHSDAQQLAEMISFTSTLAENVSAKVRQLDIARVSRSTCIFSCN